MKDINLKILVIDDNVAIHDDFIKILVKKTQAMDGSQAELEEEIFGTQEEESAIPHFTIETALQGEEGVNKIAEAIQCGQPYALAFVDIRMPPGWDGIETIKKIWQLDKDIQIVICTAYSDYTWEQTIEELGQTDNLLILKKPFDSTAVRQLACALTKKWQLMKKSREYEGFLEQQVEERTRSLSDSLARIRATMESSADGIVALDPEGNIYDYNQKFIEMWKLPNALISNRDFNVFCRYINTMLASDFSMEHAIKELATTTEKILFGIFKLKNGSVYEYYTQPYLLDSKKISRVWSFRDITKRMQLEEELSYKATHDILTDLPNRVSLIDRLKSTIKQAKSKKTQFAVIFLDIDRFKLINDSLSHHVGDKVLRLVTKQFQSAIRNSDMLARLGGDEFVIVVNEVKKRDDIEKLAQKLLFSLKEPFLLEGHEMLLTTSMGIALYPDHGKVIDELLRNADSAMYVSKELGGNQFSFYTKELNEKNINKLKQEAALRQAIANKEFFLCYQPQVELETGNLVSLEALIRWRHPTKGVILPMDFVPLAEESGLIVSIGEWVLRTACAQVKAWHDSGYPPVRVAVNVTTKQFRLYDFVASIKAILNETGLAPEFLELELTENMIINNLDMKNMIIELKALGVQFALDDFGTGYSSLNYLREIPVDRIKIDQSYVRNIDEKRGDDVIIQAIIAMANSLQLEVIAEGVETKRQMQFLTDQKCHDVQGFLLSKPLTEDECESYLKTSMKVEVDE